MKKHFIVSTLAACGLSFSAFAAPADVKANFSSAVKEVDLGGEYLVYSDFTYTHDIFNQKLPALFRKAFNDKPNAEIFDAIMASVLKLINVSAFKGVAASSMETAPGIFSAKTFVLADMQQKSIFIDNTAVNSTLDWGSLPADTRLAFKGHINFARIWDMVYNEIKFNPNPKIKALAAQLDQLTAQNGINIHSAIAAVNGNAEILITGSNIQDFAVKVVIPDKNGALSGQLKQLLPPAQNNMSQIPLGQSGLFLTVVYGNGKITAVTNLKLLQRPAQSLVSKANFRAYASRLPKQAAGYLIVDIPQEVLELVKMIASQKDARASKIFDNYLKPVSIAATYETKPNGIKSVVISNFSLYQMPLQLFVTLAGIGSEIATQPVRLQ